MLGRSTVLLAVAALVSCGADAASAPGAAAPARSGPLQATASPGATAKADVTAAYARAPGAARDESTPSRLPPVHFAQVDPSAPPAKMPTLSILAPSKGQVIPAAKAAAFAVKLRSAGWELGEGAGHLCVVLDARPCREVVDLAAPLTLAELGPALDEGQHVLSVFARRPSGESLKAPGQRAAFASLSFFVGKRVPSAWKDGGPMLFLGVPADGPSPEGGPLIDVYVANADLAGGSYRIHATVGGPGIEDGVGQSVTSLAPFRLRDAREGEYLVRFSLYRMEPDLGPSGSATTVTYSSRPVPGPFAEVTRTLRITGSRAE